MVNLPVNGLLEERAYGRAGQRGGAGRGWGGGGNKPMGSGKWEGIIDNRTARFFAFFA